MGYNSWMLGIQSNKNQGQVLDSQASTLIPNFWRIIIQPSSHKCFKNVLQMGENIIKGTKGAKVKVFLDTQFNIAC
jgi:hypothetical protein